ncbi:rhamnogalacturonidase [Niabella terrae]
MQKISSLLLILTIGWILPAPVMAQESFPDGTPISDWFRQIQPTRLEQLGKSYTITDYGVVNDSTKVQTAGIQAVIDQAAAQGGGVIVIPAGCFLSGSLFFKPGTHLYLSEGSRIKGSDDISDYKVMPTRIEGQSLKYFAALINADGVDGFTISGTGCLDGNGLRFWKAFWLRRQWNPQCTNKDEQRPRLLFVSHSRDVQISGISLINSPFWTSHYYKCERLKLLDLYIYAPYEPVKAPSSDAIDLDVCKDVLIKNCYMSVNDDAIALKGGKGPFADKDTTNGGNYNIIIEDCEYGFCHSALTCGSESIHNRNIILRNAKLNGAKRLLQLKMRPDTPQHYEYITLENIKGDAEVLLDINAWTQFFDLKGEKEMRRTDAHHIRFKNIMLECGSVWNVKKSEQYSLHDFTFERIDITATRDAAMDKTLIRNIGLKQVRINGQEIR